MNRFIVSMMVAATIFPYIVEAGLGPVPLRFVPELMGVIAAILVIVLGVRSRFRYVRVGYWLVFGALAFTFMASAVANAVEAGPIFAALRNYGRALPFFFLGAVVLLDEQQLATQLRLMTCLAFLQLPIAAYQRITTFEAGILSGDQTTGTLLVSGPLSIFLVAVACVLTAFYLRKRLSFLPYMFALAIVLIPTMLNETKITVFLVPIGLLATFILAERGTKRFSAVMKAVCLLAAFAAVFIPIYDYYIIPRTGYGIVDFFTDPDTFSDYFSKGEGADIGDTEFTRRGDAITIPFSVLSDDPVHLALGLGPGNVSDSALGDRYTGEHFAILAPFLQTLWTIVALELGFLGFGLLLILMWMLFSDARLVARRDAGIMGAISLGWAGVMGVTVVSLFYTVLMPNTALSYLFWYFAGLVAAQRMRLSARDHRSSVTTEQIPSKFPGGIGTPALSRSGNRTTYDEAVTFVNTVR